MFDTDDANRADIPALKRLWKSTFHDTNSYIDQYFNELFSKIRIVVARDPKGKPISMLSMLPVEWKRGDQRYPGHYIYAAATERRQEGKGIMTELLRFACQSAKERGDSFSCLIPATEPLFAFYQKRGYQPMFYREHLHFLPDEGKIQQMPTEITPLSIEKFTSLRTAFVQKQENVILQAEHLYPYLYAELKESGIEPLLIRSEAFDGYAVCYRIDDLLAVKETSLEEEQLKAILPQLERRFGCRGTVAAFPPRSAESAKPYGMVCPLTDLPELAGDMGYMGLLMD